MFTLQQTQGIMKKGKHKGMKKEIRGFWVDVVNSPYMSFGVDADQVYASSLQVICEFANVYHILLAFLYSLHSIQADFLKFKMLAPELSNNDM